MKNLFVVLCVGAVLPMTGVAETQVSRYSYAKDMYGDLNVGYGAKPAPYKDLFYVGGRFGLSFLTWKNEYKDVNGKHLGSDSFDFKPLLGMNIFAGYQFAEKLRADVEFGYVSQYSESETEYYDGYLPQKNTFSFETYNIVANLYYDVGYDLYIGAGVGTAISKVSLDDSFFDNKTSTTVSPMGALMFGWVNKLSASTDLDVRYRFSVFDGGQVSLGGVKTELGYVMDNSLSVGVRCYF